MAKYTELLQEYLEDNDLPTKFSDIEGFEDLFIGRYCDNEIGFETEDLFKIKLEHYAELYIPVYKERISQIANQLINTTAPVRTVYTQADIGKRKSKNTDLPIDATDVEPTSVSESDASTDNTSITEKGASGRDALEVLRYLNDRVKIMIDELLDQFKKCFMAIY